MISIVIPTKNGGTWLDQGLTAMKNQDVDEEIEIIIIDSGSQDNTLEIAKMHGIKVHQIPPSTFNHGLTRNLGVSLAQGTLIVMTVQDARPVNKSWLTNMKKHFDDERVMGVCGIQVTPHDKDKNPIQWFKRYSDPQPRKITFKSREEYLQLDGATKRELCTWDNVNAMYRKQALLSLPFQKVSFAEDAQWANDVLQNCGAIVYEPNAMVFHYHDQPFSYRFKRMFTIFYHDKLFWNSIRKPRPIIRTFAQFMKGIITSDELSISEKNHWIVYNVSLILSEWLAYLLSKISLLLGGDSLFHKLHSKICYEVPLAKSKK